VVFVLLSMAPAAKANQTLPESPQRRAQAEVTDEEVMHSLEQFIDEFYFSVIHSSLAKVWDQVKASAALLDIFELLGIKFEAGEKDGLIGMDEDAMQAQLLSMMPQDMRSSFDAVAEKVQSMLEMATRVRTAVEKNEGLQEVFEDDDTSGVTQSILKYAVVQGTKRVAKVRKTNASWRKSTESRVGRLMRSAEEAEHAMQQVLAAEAQLEGLGHSSKAKSKKALMNMADGNDKALTQTIFASWLGYSLKCKAESSIRGKFEQRIKDAEDKLIQFKERQIQNVTGVLMRAAGDEVDSLLRITWKFWTDEVNERKAAGDNYAKLKEVQDKLAGYHASQKENTKRVMAKMAADSDDALRSLCFQSWVQFSEEYKKDKEMEDAVKRAEHALQGHLAKNKEDAKAVLDRMSASSDTGLLSLVIQEWSQHLVDARKSRELEEAMYGGDVQIKNMKSRHSMNAQGVQTRVNDQVNDILLTRVYTAWLIEAKANRVTSYFTTKMEHKRRQLNGVQNLFKSFSMQLEQNLGADEDSSSRTFTGGRNQRSSRKQRVSHSHQSMSKHAEGTVSLPDIHHKQVVA